MKRLILGLCLVGGILGGCNDDLSQVGTSIQGDEDKISVFVDTFKFDASTILVDAVYAKSDTGLLGELYDPSFGTLIADYICQFYCPEGFQFRKEPLDGKIDSVDLIVYYDTWSGDSLAPMRAQVYPVTTPLTKNYYTNINPSDFCDMNTSWGMQTYTAFDKTVPDSIRYQTDSNGYDIMYNSNVTIRLPKELGQKFYEETINNPASFASQEAFNEFFPGVYITNTFGTGSILNVYSTYLNIYYKCTIKGSADQDSIVGTVETFNTTSEIIQLNRCVNNNMEELIKPNEEYTYIKSPAGVCTHIVIPSKEIAPKVEGHILNNMPLKLYVMPQDDYDFSLEVPPGLLLLPEDSVKTFFEENKIHDGKTSFLATYSNDRTYSFYNIASVLKEQIEKAPDEDLRLVVVPVKYTSNYYGYTSIRNYLMPSGLKVRIEDEKTQLIITSSKYGRTE
ncbi:hypothetical protein M2101_000188 [Parabacteroides sp. PM5-20]|uniref:DUF4270 domain-containing protein n=1 Tax=unclassified Parabacteroides TaxID=2649774 RepID=UPI00247C41FC|nr:DUF4270 domain-containing protein [Parabacteroides sp. 52]MDH6533547.1 hypothetical protein [Parabacteroides sp. PM5-20]